MRWTKSTGPCCALRRLGWSISNLYDSIETDAENVASRNSHDVVLNAKMVHFDILQNHTRSDDFRILFVSMFVSAHLVIM